MASILLPLLALCLPPICKWEINGKSLVIEYNVSLHTVHMSSQVTCLHDPAGLGALVSCTLFTLQQANFKHLLNILLLNDCLTPSENSWLVFMKRTESRKISDYSRYTHMLKCIITFMLFLSGNIQPDPEPLTNNIC